MLRSQGNGFMLERASVCTCTLDRQNGDVLISYSSLDILSLNSLVYFMEFHLSSEKRS